MDLWKVCQLSTSLFNIFNLPLPLVNIWQQQNFVSEAFIFVWSSTLFGLLWLSCVIHFFLSQTIIIINFTTLCWIIIINILIIIIIIKCNFINTYYLKIHNISEGPRQSITYPFLFIWQTWIYIHTHTHKRIHFVTK